MLARSENDSDFFSRRALEEARAAAVAKSIEAGAAHRHMAAVYAARLRDEQLAAEGISDPLGDLDHREIVADEADAEDFDSADCDDGNSDGAARQD